MSRRRRPQQREHRSRVPAGGAIRTRGGEGQRHRLILHSMFLLAAFTPGRHDLLSSALEDRIHQPYRAPFCLLLPGLQEMAGKPGVLGVALSGAGPSVISFLDPRSSAQKTRKSIAAHLAGIGLAPSCSSPPSPHAAPAAEHAKTATTESYNPRVSWHSPTPMIKRRSGYPESSV